MTSGKSFGNADVATIACRDTATADAFATAFANIVQTGNDVDLVLNKTQSIDSIVSAVIIVDNRIGIQGGLELTLL